MIGYCENHYGDAFAPRCIACETLQAEYGTLGMSRCPRHPAHFRPCAKGCDD